MQIYTNIYAVDDAGLLTTVDTFLTKGQAVRALLDSNDDGRFFINENLDYVRTAVNDTEVGELWYIDLSDDADELADELNDGAAKDYADEMDTRAFNASLVR